MKYSRCFIIITLMLLGNSCGLYAQKDKKVTIEDWRKKAFLSISKEEVDIVKILKEDPSLYFTRVDEKIDVYNFFRGGAELATSGNTMAKKYIINCLSSIYEHLIESNQDNSLLPSIYRTILPTTLYKMPPSESLFEIGLKYASLNISYLDGHGYEENYGISTIRVLLQMISSDQWTEYQIRFSEIFDSEDSINVAHSKFYPILKQDWESGKIKLREPTSDQ